MKFAAKGLIVIGWIYILLIIVIMSADIGGWSKVFNLFHSWRDTVVVTLIILPGMGLVLLGDKLGRSPQGMNSPRNCGRCGGYPARNRPL